MIDRFACHLAAAMFAFLAAGCMETAKGSVEETVEYFSFNTESDESREKVPVRDDPDFSQALNKEAAVAYLKKFQHSGALGIGKCDISKFGFSGLPFNFWNAEIFQQGEFYGAHVTYRDKECMLFFQRASEESGSDLNKVGNILIYLGVVM